MPYDLLDRAAREVEAASEDATDSEAADRLARLAEQLRSQAEREATPALGALDRIQHFLGKAATRTHDDAVANRVENARDLVFSFLETLDDRGMKQHGLPTETKTDDSE